MFYKITLTKSGGLSVDDCEGIVNYFEKESGHCYLVNEFGECEGNSHIEGIVEFETKTTSNVTDRVRRLYEALGIEEVQGISFKVKRATHLVGCLIYASKELTGTGKVLLMKGWKQTWIDKQVKDNVKNIPHSMLKKKGTRVTQGAGPALMYEWCKANGREIHYKQDYLEVVRSMADEGYMFGMCRTVGLYQDVCALFGDGAAAVAVAESDLRFID